MTREEIKQIVQNGLLLKSLGKTSKQVRFILSVPDEEIEYMEEAVCDIIGIDVELLRSGNRKRESVYARQILWYFLLDRGATYEWIANRYKKHHATIIHGKRKVDGFLDVEDNFFTFVINNLDKHFKEHFEQYNLKSKK